MAWVARVAAILLHLPPQVTPLSCCERPRRHPQAGLATKRSFWSESYRTILFDCIIMATSDQSYSHSCLEPYTIARLLQLLSHNCVSQSEVMTVLQASVRNAEHSHLTYNGVTIFTFASLHCSQTITTSAGFAQLLFVSV